MSSNSDQLAILGQKVIDTLIATYNPTNEPSVALAIHPGQALADDIVQNGATNPLRLSEWIEDQYDYPLWLKRSDTSSISSASIGGLTAKSAYLAMVPWARPSVPADSPAYARLAALIAKARQDLGDNPDALPFGCEPTDFAQDDSTCWHVFDQTITSSTASTATAPSSPVKINPQMWKMRGLTEDFIAALPRTDEIATRRRSRTAALAPERRIEAVEVMRNLGNHAEFALRPLELAHASPAAPPAASPAVRRFAADRQMARRLVVNRRHWSNPEEPPLVVPGHREEEAPSRIAGNLRRLGAAQLTELVRAPTVTEVATSNSELHVHFEYCLLTITRRLAGNQWWHAGLIAEDDWYVPGMKRGDMVPPSTAGDYAPCLPQGLILVRNVEFRGSWTQEARAALQSAASFLGPFLVKPPRTAALSTSSDEQISVLGDGIQVIGELCFPLPPLPPTADPAIDNVPVH